MSGLAETRPVDEGITIESADDLTLEVVVEVAYESRRLTLSDALLADVDASRHAMLAALEAGATVYGVTTGTGYLSTVSLVGGKQPDHEASMLVGRAVGSAPFLPVAEARALLVARLVNFVSCSSGVSAALCRFLVDRLNDSFTPAVPRRGSGTAGDIIALSHAFQTFVGIGRVLGADGTVERADQELARREVAAYAPVEKEGIAILAGAPGSCALALGRLRAAQVLADQLLTAATCSAAAIAGPHDAYDPAVGALAGDPRIAAVNERIRALLGAPPAERRVTQTPVSFRVVPQAHAYLERTVARLEEDLRRALATVSDSPAFVDGRFVSTGAFHEVGLAAAMDALAVALCHVAELAGQRVSRLLDERFTGLPNQLTPTPGLACGLVVVHKRVLGALNELRRLAAPTLIGLADSSLGQEDAMTFTYEGADRLRRMEELVREITACELLTARQAMWLRGTTVRGGLADVVGRLEEVVPPVDTDRPLGPDLDGVIELLQRGGLRAPMPTPELPVPSR